MVFFSFFAISANLPTRGHMIDFLVNLVPNLNPKTHQKSTQEAPKIDKKGYSKHDASWLGIWNPLGTNLGGFWVQVGRQVGAKLAPKSEKIGYRKINKKSSKTSHKTSTRRQGSWPLRIPSGSQYYSTIIRHPDIQ